MKDLKVLVHDFVFVFGGAVLALGALYGFVSLQELWHRVRAK